MELPTSLNYTASKSVIKYKRFNVRTTSTNSGGANSTFRFVLPNGLLNLSSFELCFDLKITGLDDNQATIDTLQAELQTLQTELAALQDGSEAHTAKEAEITAKQNEIDDADNREDYSNVKMPFGHKLIREIKVMVNNQQVNAKCGDYDLLYTALFKATASSAYARNKQYEHAQEMILNSDDFGVINPDAVNEGDTSKSASYVVSDFLGIFRSGDKSIIDCSLWGQVELEFIINDKYCLAQYAKGSGSVANIKFELSNVEGYIEKVVEINPVYNKLVDMMLSSRKEPLLFCYQNFVSQISSTKSARLQIRSQCIDGVICFPLSPNYLNTTATFNPGNRINAPRYQFNSGRNINRFNTLTTKNCSLQMTINGDKYPDVPINNALHVASVTNQALFNGSMYSQGILFDGLFDDRNDFLKENFIWFQSLCGGVEGYVNKIMTGYDTRGISAEIIIDHDCIVDGGSLFVGALTTSCLSLDPVSKQMTVIE